MEILIKSVRQYLTLSNSEDLLEISKKSIVNCEKLVFNKKMPSDLDYFGVKFSPYIYISEELKNEIEKESLTGLNIKEAYEPMLEWVI